jgi:hypothetical protein
MILQRLVEHYDRVSASGDEEMQLAPPGFSRQKISFCVVLDLDGRLSLIKPETEPKGNRQVATPMLLPGQGKPSGQGINPCFLWDNAAYMLGWTSDVDKRERAASCFESFRDKHLALEGKIVHPAFSVVCSFLRTWTPEMAMEFEEQLATIAGRTVRALGAHDQMPDQEDLLVITEAALGTSDANEISIGPEALDFLTRVVPESSRETVQSDAVAILSKATPTNVAVGTQTGLVVGYVQSGKTMSFETVAALARDNRFQVVIVVAGTSTPLLDQSTSRLKRDLQLDDPSRARRWLQVMNPSNDETTAQNIRNVLDDWSDPQTPPDWKKTVLITVLKHYGRLDTVSQLLARVGMQGAPTLIIDDEADHQQPPARSQLRPAQASVWPGADEVPAGSRDDRHAGAVRAAGADRHQDGLR